MCWGAGVREEVPFEQKTRNTKNRYAVIVDIYREKCLAFVRLFYDEGTLRCIRQAESIVSFTYELFAVVLQPRILQNFYTTNLTTTTVYG